MQETKVQSQNELGSRRGRPSKFTPTAVQTICSAIEDGVPFKFATAMAGISMETFSKWKQRYPEFHEGIQNAVARGIHARLNLITEAAKNDHRAAQWWLEHVYPQHFAKTRLEIRHEGTIEHGVAIPQSTFDEIAEARQAYEEQRKIKHE